jgi:hypothetical protein
MSQIEANLRLRAGFPTWVAICCQEEVAIPLVYPVGPAVGLRLVNLGATKGAVTQTIQVVNNSPAIAMKWYE